MNPKDRITTYLFNHKSTVERSNVDAVVKDVKLSVFYGFSPIPDSEIRTIVVQWATFNAPGLLITQPAAGPPASPDPKAPSNSHSEFIDAVKKAVKTVNDGVTLGDEDGGNINIGVTGLTANLKTPSGSAALGLSWGGALKLNADSGPFHFEGTLAKDKWEISLSFPEDTYVPNMATLGDVFSKGMTALGKMADATRSFNNIGDVTKVSALIKPNVDAVQDAVEAVSGIAKAPKKGGWSFGFKAGSPEAGPGQQGIPGGLEVKGVLTYIW